jgi:hypothetical protein
MLFSPVARAGYYDARTTRSDVNVSTPSYALKCTKSEHHARSKNQVRRIEDIQKCACTFVCKSAEVSSSELMQRANQSRRRKTKAASESSTTQAGERDIYEAYGPGQRGRYRGKMHMRHTKLALFIAITFLLTTAAWSREDKLTNTGLAPAAAGTVSTSNDRNGNTEIEVKVKHMATPQSLTPPAQNYLVWVQPRGQQAELLGALRINADSLEGSLKGTTTYKDFDVLVTAENSTKPDVPSDAVILKGTVERK